MTEEEWALFLAGEGQETRLVCRVRREVIAHLDAYTDAVLLRRDYAHKKLFNHRVPLADFVLLSEVIGNGQPIDDRERHVTYIYYDNHEDRRVWLATIKINKSLRKIYVQTFHKLRPQEARRKLKRYPKITTQK